ncbi:MAG: hypothetical protein JWO67_1840 [Streptosporangiaceae bacterium]|nr:hypothetical protein [Streptosporangiaceae bacterium]
MTEPEAAALGPSGLQQVSKIVGAVVAPTTLLTSLLYYFGWAYAYWFFYYFGVNSTLLGLTTGDYLMRSVDALFLPMTVGACAGLFGLWGHAVLRARLAAGSRPRLISIGLPVVALLGLVLTVGGISSIVATTLLNRYLAAAPLSMASGVLLLTYAVHLRRSLMAQSADRGARPEWASVGEWGVVFVLVGLSLFWAATDYAAAVGTRRARESVAELPDSPSAVVYSERSLSLHAPGVREVRCDDPKAAYHFRYDGLKLILQSGDQYLFLPQAWTPAKGVTIIMPRNNSLRLEFIWPSALGTAQSGTC